MKSFYFLIALSILIVSCNKNKRKGETGPQGLAGTAALGQISGTVQLWGNDNKVLSAANITVGVIGKSIHSVTDAQGKYKLENVPAGMLDLEFTGSAAYTQVQQVAFPGNGTLVKNVQLVSNSTFTLNAILRDSTYSNQRALYVKLDSAASPTLLDFVILLSQGDSINPRDPNTYQVALEGTAYLQPKATTLVPIASSNIPFKLGDKVKAMLYPYNKYLGAYFDVYLNRWVYASAGKAAGSGLKFVW